MTAILDTPFDPPTSALERVTTLRHVRKVLLRGAAVIGFSALWGLAAGSANLGLALANVYKVPMVVCLTVVVTLPAVFVTRSLLRAPIPPDELVAALVTALYRGALVLLGFAPLVAVYAYTSQWFSPWLAQASALLALVSSAYALGAELRSLEGPPRVLWTLAGVATVVLGLALLQLIAVATPILPVPTVFGQGLDGVVR